MTSSFGPSPYHKPTKSDSVINFDDGQEDDFARQVMRLAQGDTEDDFERRLLAQAQSRGIAVPRNNSARPMSTSGSISGPQRSLSRDSHISSISALTFDLSKNSARQTLDKERAKEPRRRESETSSSITDNEYASLNTRIPISRSRTFSPSITPTVPSASLPARGSIGATPQRKSFIRSFSRLRVRRNEDGDFLKGECPHCPRNSPIQRQPIHHLPCGHSFCAQGLRRIVKTSILQNPNFPPSCCNLPIPRQLVQRAVGEEDRGRPDIKNTTWDETASGMSSISLESSSGTSTPATPDTSTSMRKQRYRSLANESSILAAQEAQMSLAKALEIPSLQHLRSTQEAQRDRFMVWAQHRRDEISNTYTVLQEETTRDNMRRQSLLAETHTTTLSEVEDKHVLAEAHLRSSHETEKRNAATALRHMEAYVRGVSSTGIPHNRTVTDQDLRELERARRNRDSLTVRHESAINVLRGEQGRRVRTRQQKLEKERESLEAEEDREREKQQAEMRNEIEEWEEQVGKRRLKMQGWFDLETEIWRRTMEDSGTYVGAPLPCIIWDDETAAQSLPGADRYSTDQDPSYSVAKGKGITTGFAVRSSNFG